MNDLNHGSAPGVADSLPDGPITRTSARAAALGFSVTPADIDGASVFLVSREGLSRVLPSVAAVDEFLSRVSTAGGRHA
jgi:hypothetical protein